jgi:glycosyltransferase involved in cell wall biosynthesis
MKIAIMIDSLAIGGAQKHVRQLACALSGEGHAVTVWVLNEIVEPLYVDPLVEAGVGVEVVGRRQVVTGVGLLRVAACWWKTRVDLVVVVLFASTVLGRIAAQLAGGVPVVTSLQARNLDYGWKRKLLVRITARLTRWTVSNSRAALGWAAENEGLAVHCSSYLPNAIDPPGVVERLPTWGELGLPQLEGRIVVGSLGRLNRQKGYDVLLAAVALLAPEQRSKLAVLVWGEGPERDALESQRLQLQLEETVFLPGQRPDAVEILPKLDVYVQPSRFEGTPNAVIEALVAGVPVVASAVDGLVDLRAAGWRMNLVEWDSTGSALAAALATAVAAPEDRASPRDPAKTCPPVPPSMSGWLAGFRSSFQLSVI